MGSMTPELLAEAAILNIEMLMRVMRSSEMAWSPLLPAEETAALDPSPGGGADADAAATATSGGGGGVYTVEVSKRCWGQPLVAMKIRAELSALPPAVADALTGTDARQSWDSSCAW